MSILERFENKFHEALLDHERRVLLTLLAQQLSSITFAEFAEILSSPLGTRLGPIKVSALFEHPGDGSDHAPRSLPQRRPGRPQKDSSPPASSEQTAPMSPAWVPNDLGLEAEIVRELQSAGTGLSPASLRARLDHDPKRIQEAVKHLVGQQVLQRRGVGRATTYSLNTHPVAPPAWWKPHPESPAPGGSTQ